MFDIPNAKSVRREELLGDSSSDVSISDSHVSDDDEYYRQQLHEKLGRQLELDFAFEQSSPTVLRVRSYAGDPTYGRQWQGDEAEGPDAEEEEEFEFRLFAGTSINAPGKVALRGENEISTTEGKILTRRPLSYYTPGPATGKQLERFEFAAVTPESVLHWARQRNWGLEMPWRVTTITSTEVMPTMLLPHRDPGTSSGKEAAKKKRPGKKSRIAMRKRANAREERLAAAEKQKEEKEEHLKEKRKRMNRLKKLRKRAKKKAVNDGEGAENNEDELSDGAE